MPYKDLGKQKEYQREWQRQRRAGETVGFKVLRVSSPEEIRTAQRLLSVLGHLISEVLITKQGDIFMKVRTAGYLISIGLKTIEVADLEARSTALLLYGTRESEIEAITASIDYYGYRCYHEGLGGVTPYDAYTDRHLEERQRRKEVKKKK